MIALAWLPCASAGTLEGEVALDGLHATSTSSEPASGATPGLSASELGIRVRGTVEEGRVLGALDYQGREPVAGTFQNSTFRLFYRAEVVGTLVPETWQLAAGRFLAPSVVFLPVDGARTVLTPTERLRFELFGGRRGITSSRENLGFDTMLPAVGGSAGYVAPDGQVEVQLAWAGDQVQLGTTTSPYVDEYTALNGQVRGSVEPTDGVVTGGSLAFAQRATYVLGPVGDDPLVEVQALDLFHGLLFASWRPTDDLRLDVDGLHQATQLFRGGVEATPPGDVALVDPTFTDVRLRLHGRPLDVGWIRPDARLRLRPGRTELRYGVGADLDHLGLTGPFVRAKAYVDDILMDDTGDDVASVDRLLWSLSGGYARGGFEGEAGASFIDRAAAPVSGRVSAAGLPTTSDDLQPFVLEAQNILFARAFFATGRLFGGADLEVNALDAEVRALVQVGVLGEASW